MVPNFKDLEKNDVSTNVYDHNIQNDGQERMSIVNKFKELIIIIPIID